MISNHNSTLQISRSDLLGWSTSFLRSLQLSGPAFPFSLSALKRLLKWRKSAHSTRKGLGWVSSSMLRLLWFARAPFTLQHFAFRLMLQVITKQITQWHWQTLQCFCLYRMIYHSIKLKYRTSIKLLLVTTKIKLEGHSLVAPTRDYSRRRVHARWLTSLTRCESVAMTSKVIDSVCSVAPTTPYLHRQRLTIKAQRAVKDFDNISSPWK